MMDHHDYRLTAAQEEIIGKKSDKNKKFKVTAKNGKIVFK